MRRPRVRDHPMVFVDSNVYFYARNHDRVFGEACDSVLADVADGRLDAYSSVLAIAEAANAVRKVGKPAEMYEMASAITSLPVTLVDLTQAIAADGSRRAVAARGDPYDGAHVASAVSLGIRTIISTDTDMDRFEGISRLDPRDYFARRHGPR